MLLVLIAAIGVAGLVYFTVRSFQLLRGYQALSQVEKRRTEIAAQRGDLAKVTLRQRLAEEGDRLGLGGNLFPLYAALSVAYLAVAAPLSTFVPLTMALPAAAPLAGLLGWGAVGFAARRRRSAFNRQLVDLLDLTVSQIRGGVGAERALHIVVPQLPNPIREEMEATLAAGAAGKDLVAAMADLARRYPSRAFEMFLAALEIDRAEGHAIAPALDQAATLLKQDFALAAEANSKLGQVKYEFYAVAAIVAAIGIFLIMSGGETIQKAYTTPAGLIVIAIAAGNGALGFFRFNRKITKLTGDTK